ncbi:MAG: hypothetical protein HUU15_08125, partial [Candidatus Brocadiae bacterium]|nr:hypothetical protein [Candidatus Brocadiia bacterium]
MITDPWVDLLRVAPKAPLLVAATARREEIDVDHPRGPKDICAWLRHAAHRHIDRAPDERRAGLRVALRAREATATDRRAEPEVQALARLADLDRVRHAVEEREHDVVGQLLDAQRRQLVAPLPRLDLQAAPAFDHRRAQQEATERPGQAGRRRCRGLFRDLFRGFCRGRCAPLAFGTQARAHARRGASGLPRGANLDGQVGLRGGIAHRGRQAEAHHPVDQKIAAIRVAHAACPLHQRLDPVRVEEEEAQGLRRQHVFVGHQVVQRHAVEQHQPAEPGAGLGEHGLEFGRP